MFDDDTTGTVFRDVILLALAGFVMMVVLLLPHINPVGEDDEEDIKNVGNLIVEVVWDRDLDTDVDVWMLGPKENKAVGYSNKSGRNLNLVRDDLGKSNDDLDINYENIFSRGVPAGEWIVNLHLFGNRAGRLPVEVRVKVSMQKEIRSDKSSKVEEIYSTTATLHRLREEITVVRFKTDNDYNVIPGSIHDAPIGLREKQ